MKKKWYRLDNAALIFPAIKRKNWNNVFRVSATLKEAIDVDCLQKAVDDLKYRFPTFYVRIKTGFFWYYLEEIKKPVTVRQDYAYPLTFMSKKEMSSSCLRVLYYENRISCEFFHSVSDGTGGMMFLKNLLARYLEIKYGKTIPKECAIVDYQEEPKEEEIRDGFPICSGKFPARRNEDTVYRLRGTFELGNYRHLITGIIPTEKLIEIAHKHKVTATAFLAAVMAESIIDIQKTQLKEKSWRPVKITIPVNLRKLYGVDTFRNFALTVNIGVDPKNGDYTLEEMCQQMSHQIASEVVPQKMAGKIAANVIPQQNPIIRIMPLFIKTFVMRLIYSSTGESGGCLNISNLGNVEVPVSMKEYIERFEFIIGVQFTYPNNCSIASFGGNTYINMIRSKSSAELERRFFSRLVDLGIPVEIESNYRGVS